jgi:hypothetical protein
MKKYIYGLFVALLATATMTSCVEDEGTEPGNDSNPAITIYQYKVSKPYNVDNDVSLRFAANNKTTEAYYLVEKTTDKDARIASLGNDAYMDYVVSNGTKLSEISGESVADAMLIDLYGEYTITAVAVGAGAKTSSATVFTGLDWADVAVGTYSFSSTIVGRTGVSSSPTVLQVCTTDANLYRFKDICKNEEGNGKGGYHLKINLIDQKDTDADGEYQFFRVPAQETSFTYGSYGAVNVRDIGYWQGSDAWVTDNGYESGMYADHSCFIFVQYYVSGGSLGYNYDFFIPD